MFDDIRPGPVDPFFDLKKNADQDNHPAKVDIGVGIYRGENGKYQELAVVKKAKKILDELDLGHDYELTTGDDRFLKLASELMFGQDSEVVATGRVASVQTLSGSGANHLAAVLIAKSVDPKPEVYIGAPTWSNTKPLFAYVGLKTIEYSYLDRRSSKIDFRSCLSAIQNAPNGSVFPIQGCCHNPTGKDLSLQQWQHIGDEIKTKGHLPFIDIAYQGLGDGLDEDAAGVRILSRMGINMIVCQSFSKNFALYGERCGVLHVVTQTPGIAANVKDQLRSLIRREYSSSPAYGSRLVTIVLGDPELREEWIRELSSMRARLQENRSRLHSELTTVLKTPGDWKHLVEEKGLFSCVGIKPEQCNILINQHHVHLPANGRINVAGLNPSNVERTARALDAVVREGSS